MTELNNKILSRSDYMHFQIAVRYFLNFKKSRDKFISSESISKLKEMDWENISIEEFNRLKIRKETEKIIKHIFEIRTFGIISNTNSVICLEGLINLYGTIKSSNSYFKKYLEKLDVISKWVVIPRLFTQSEIDRDSMHFEYFKKLIQLRNEMIHPKSKILEVQQDDELPKPEMIIKLISNVEKQFKAMLHMIIELHEIDPDFQPINIYEFLWDEEKEMLRFSEYESFTASIFTKQMKNDS